jgi:Raf kinase inhibitor-like YbhB/YbcL family protein
VVGRAAAAKSLALIVDDPDAPDPKAPQKPWVHWVLYNLPTDLPGLRRGAAPRPTCRRRPSRARTTGTATGYRGPCPPTGRHRYVHKLYALDTILTGLASPTKAELEAAMKGHVVAEAQLVGTYQRPAQQ